MRPLFQLLSDELIEKVIGEARDLLCKLGIEVYNQDILTMLGDWGCEVDMGNHHVKLNNEIISRSLETVPQSFRLYDVNGNETHNFTDDNVYFTPGSAALNILDFNTGKIRKPTTEDYIKYAKVIENLDNITSQSTALIPADVHEKIQDSYRLLLSLLFCSKPVVTGAFTVESFNIMKELQVVIRGSERELEKKPLTVFSCCPTSPLKWSDVTSQNLVDCAMSKIPVELISMPLSGFIAPVTIVGTLIQHTAETLSGIVISQLTNSGAPLLYGGSPAIFDIRYETTPMGAVETEMIVCAYNEIGKYLGIPTQGYITLSDSKQLDAQAGLETSMGAVLAGLSGINNISGPGMLDFESCQSVEKLVLDNEICGMVYRLIEGIEPKEDFPSISHFEDLIRDRHLLIAEHTRKYIGEEFYLPDPVINRSGRVRWEEEGSKTLNEVAHEKVEEILDKYSAPHIPEDKTDYMIKLMEGEAERYGMDELPFKK